VPSEFREESSVEDRLRDVGGDDGEGSEIEAGVEVFVVLENEGGEDDAVDRFEVHRQTGGVGAESAQEVNEESMGEDRAEKGEGEEGKPVGGNGNFGNSFFLPTRTKRVKVEGFHLLEVGIKNGDIIALISTFTSPEAVGII